MSLEHIGPLEIVSHPGSIYILAGGMKAGKTLRFVQFCERMAYGQINSQIFKPACDVRPELHNGTLPEHHIVSRTGMNIEATFVDNKGDLSDLLRQINPETHLVGLEEIHLYEQPDKVINAVLNLTYNQRKSVLVSGLDLDFRGHPFPAITTLMAHARNIAKVYGICDQDDCHLPGRFSQRIINEEPAPYTDDVLLVGASEAYETRCEHHHEVPGRPKGWFKSQ